ncbi:hypothetical protein [Novosphingobium taihuense]|nr:hypothetical protein [Novosphingobium taihuense]TWH88194.1 hypothetical protein IQ25_00309 [Novosphingobium taihuense]
MAHSGMPCFSPAVTGADLGSDRTEGAGGSSVVAAPVDVGDGIAAGATVGVALGASRTDPCAEGSAAGRVGRGAGVAVAGEADGEGRGAGVIDGAGVGVTAGFGAGRGGGASDTTGPWAAGVWVLEGGNCHEPASCACATLPSARHALAVSQKPFWRCAIWKPVLNVMAGQGRSAV